MKKLFLLLLVIFITTICNAQIEVRKDESLGYVPINEFPKANFTTSPEALKYSLSFDEAIANPGKKILVKDSTNILRLKFLLKSQVEAYKSYIVFNDKTNNIDFIEPVQKMEERTCPFVLVSIISIILMLISNILIKIKYEKLGIVALFALLFAAPLSMSSVVSSSVSLSAISFTDLSSIISSANLFPIASFSFAGMAVFNALAAIFSLLSASLPTIKSHPFVLVFKGGKNYNFYSVMFYIFMVAHIILLFV